MKAGHASCIAAAAVLFGSMFGCSTAGKSAAKPLAGVSLPGIKSDDKALRTAVEKDPFPRAQGTLAATKSRPSAATE